MLQILLKIIRSKIFVYPILFFITVCISIQIYYSNIQPIVIFPNFTDYHYITYTDFVNQGNSEVVYFDINDSIIHFRFRLKNGFVSPYAGISIKNNDNNIIDVSNYNQITVCVSGVNLQRIGISLFAPSGFIANKKIDDEVIYHSYLEISEELNEYNISLNDFRFPEWWADIHQIPEKYLNTTDLANILNININSAYSPDITEVKSINLKYMSFSRNNKRLFNVLNFGLLVVLLLMVIVLYFIEKIKHNKSLITISYKPVEVSNEVVGDELCIDFINRNYSNFELTLDIISSQTGVASRKITALINEKYGCNFKTYLNNIRINESKRLLTETDMNIGEIAYKVGFNSQSHFNRVFKSVLNQSPTEFRDKSR